MMYALPDSDDRLWKSLRYASPYFVVDGIDRLVGGFTLTRQSRMVGTFGLLVMRNWSGAGYGKAIVSMIEKRAKDCGLTTLRVDAYAKNAPMIALAERSNCREFRWFERNI